MRFRVEKGESFARVHRESSYLRFIERGSAFGREKEQKEENEKRAGKGTKSRVGCWIV